jgi:membrane associated rhomboid family serine protease
MLNDITNYFKKGSTVSRMIGINVAIFVVFAIVRLFFYLWNNSGVTSEVINWLAVSSNTNILISKPWTLVTYSFLHLHFFHILFNMIVLYVGGRLFSQFVGEGRLVPTYILGAITGALFYVAAYNFFPVFADVRSQAVAWGASASVLAIFFTVAVFQPNYQLPLLLFGRIRLKYIALIFIVIDLLSIERGNPGGHIAHLGGAAWGFLYATLLKSRLDPAGFFYRRYRWLKGFFSRKPRMKVKYTHARPVNDYDYNKQRAENQKEIDEILDKISKSGYQSLSAKEKEMLFNMSKRS